jgi:hypothetical protein
VSLTRGPSRFADWLSALACVVASLSCALALIAAWRWPLVGDAALMRYVVFLLHAGRAPYREIVDINLPGSYFVEWSAVHLFGAGAHGLRLYDGFLCALAGGGAVALSEPGLRERLCGLLAGFLFVLIHLRDGVVQGGERDLAMAAMVVLAYVVLLRGPLAGRLTGLVSFELLIGLTLTIKPSLLPLAVVPGLQMLLSGQKLSSRRAALAAGLAALLLPLAVMFVWLHHAVSLAAFVGVLRTVDAAHRGLARESLLTLLRHSVAPIAIVFGLAAVLALRLKTLDNEGKLLLFGAVCGLISFLAQGKGFPYQRYPFLLLALVLVGRLVARALGKPGLTLAVAAVLVAVSGFWLAPMYAATVRSYDAAAPFEQALAHDLTVRGAVNGSVQCLDTVGGCINTLYDLRLTQSTGFLYDCYAYQGTDQAAYREAFLAALEVARPRTIVFTSQFCLEQHYGFGRIDQWPELKRFLAEDYRLDGAWQARTTVRWWHQRETPPGYEIFTRR